MRLPNFLSRWGVFFNHKYLALSFLTRIAYYLFICKRFVKALQTAKPSKLSMPPLVQSFRHKNIERNFRSNAFAGFAGRSGKICPSQKMEHLCESTRQVNKVVANSKSYFTKRADEPNYVDIGCFLRNHKKMMESLGQEQYLINAHYLESAFQRPKWIFHYSSDSPNVLLFKMVNGLAESIIINHPFLDGNKRAALLAIDMFLALNGYLLYADEASVTEITQGVATGDINIDELECWIAKNVKNVKKCQKATVL